MFLFSQPPSPRRRAPTTRTSSTTSTRTASPTASSSTRSGTRRSAAFRRGRWARRGATGTRWTCSSARAPRRTRPTDGDVVVGKYVTPDRESGSRASTARSARPRRSARAGPRPAPAASPTATTAACSASPRCTPTARSGPRRSGICAPRSASRRRARWSRGRWSCLRRTRRSSTCGTRSSRRTSSPPAAPNAATIWSVFAKRGMGYFSGRVQRRRRRPGRELLAAAGAEGEDREAPGDDHGRRHRPADPGRSGRVRRSRLRLPG